MLAAMNDAVGDIARAIDRNELADKTLNIFTSGHDRSRWQTTSFNGQPTVSEQ